MHSVRSLARLSALDLSGGLVGKCIDIEKETHISNGRKILLLLFFVGRVRSGGLVDKSVVKCGMIFTRKRSETL